MKLLVAVSCLLAAVAATPLFGTEQCANGPEVWCVNVRTASQCGAVKHCQQTVWNKPVVKTVPCDVCKEVITIVGNFLKENGTQNEILAYLNKACELIPDPSLTSQCKELVAEYYPVILNIIESELSNPSVACCAMGLCSSLQQHLASLKRPQQLLTNEIPEVDLSKVVYPYMANLPLLLNPQDKTHEEPKNGDVCKDCLQLFNDVQELLKTNSSFSKLLIENALKQCDQLGGGLSEMCKTYINQYADLAIQMIIQMDQPAQQICSSAGLCAQEKSTPILEIVPAKVVPAAKLQPAVKIAEKPVGLNPVCDVCQVVVTKLESLLEKNSSKEQIQEALEKVCYIIPVKYRQQCKDFIDTYSSAIIELLEQEITPEQICQAIGLCAVRQPQMIKLSPEQIQSGGYCEVCKMMINYMDKMLKSNVTEEKIKAALKVVCSFLPDSMCDECDALVLAYEPLFIELILQSLDPKFVCEKLTLCLAARKPLLGSEKCMWGPSYWCKDLETAGSCNAIEHCKRHVWN
ncbi:prosaposin isoform X1 [Bufo bufo]|uniref:prosaposin isoform X1 n=1 Tax=Bufo bufo TaxID=8384 RepID=UPI001ABE10F8|nr:prosaposin isoform X1 [Bufo bufo]